MGGVQRSRTAQSPRLPPGLSELEQASTRGIQALQQAAPVTPFLQPMPLQVPGLTGLQQRGIAEVPGLFDLAQRRVTGANIQASPAFQAGREAFTTSIEPRVVNQATLAGLGRSTALPNALAQAEAQFLQPLIEAEFGREERGITREAELRLRGIEEALRGGGLERGVEQERAAAAQQDALRREAIAETALFSPFQTLAPASIGQVSRTSGKSGFFT